MIPYARQSVSEQDIEAVVSVLRSDWLTQGPAIERFEQAVAAYCGARHAVAMSSATAALHAACVALGVGPGDLVWTVPNTFVASANCARYCGADVDFVDIDPRTYNMSVAAFEVRLAAAARARRLPKVVIPVDFAGQSCELAQIGALAAAHGVRVLEDASHAIGGRYGGTPVGCGNISAVTVFSFHPVKIITSGEGGMAVTNDDALAVRLRRFRSHGISRDPASMAGVPDGPWYYEQIDLGFNYRMTDMAAALGASQLERVDEFVVRRAALAARYDRLLANLPVIRPWQHESAASAWHLYVIQVDPGRVSVTRREVFDRLLDGGVRANVHYIPVHLQPYYRSLGFAAGDFPNAEHYYAHALSLPMFHDFREEDQDRVVELLGSALQ